MICPNCYDYLEIFEESRGAKYLMRQLSFAGGLRGTPETQLLETPLLHIFRQKMHNDICLYFYSYLRVFCEEKKMGKFLRVGLAPHTIFQNTSSLRI